MMEYHATKNPPLNWHLLSDRVPLFCLILYVKKKKKTSRSAGGQCAFRHVFYIILGGSDATGRERVRPLTLGQMYYMVIHNFQTAASTADILGFFLFRQKA